MVRVSIFLACIFSIFLSSTSQKKSINDVYFEELDGISGIGKTKAMRICIEKEEKPFSDFNDFIVRNTKTGEVVNERLKKEFKF